MYSFVHVSKPMTHDIMHHPSKLFFALEFILSSSGGAGAGVLM
jgi:hypothetical protein